MEGPLASDVWNEDLISARAEKLFDYAMQKWGVAMPAQSEED